MKFVTKSVAGVFFHNHARNWELRFADLTTRGALVRLFLGAGTALLSRFIKLYFYKIAFF